MKVPLVDLTSKKNTLQNEIDKKIKKVISNGQFILGEEVELFESKFASYVR